MKWVLRITGSVVALAAIVSGTLLLAGFRQSAGKSYAEIEIGQPRAKVFAWVTEPHLLKQWVSGYVSATQLYGCPTSVGAKGVVTMNVGGEKRNFVTTLLAFEKDKLLRMRFQGAEFNMILTVSAEDAGGLTKIRYSTEAEYSNPIYRFMEPVIAWSAQKKLETDLASLRQRAEAQKQIDHS